MVEWRCAFEPSGIFRQVRIAPISHDSIDGSTVQCITRPCSTNETLSRRYLLLLPPLSSFGSIRVTGSYGGMVDLPGQYYSSILTEHKQP